MMLVRLMTVGDVPAPVLAAVVAGISSELPAGCRIQDGPYDPSFAYHPERRQYHATELLTDLRRKVTPGIDRLLAITDADLYIPILTFVFGEAQLDGPCAIVSTHRLREEYYGLPPDAGLLRARTVKEALHELGHTLNLRHCDDRRCLMASSHSVEWIDLKSGSFCNACRVATGTARTPASR